LDAIPELFVLTISENAAQIAYHSIYTFRNGEAAVLALAHREKTNLINIHEITNENISRIIWGN